MVVNDETGEKSAKTLEALVFEYIETDYNTVRLHLTNGFLNPVEFETLFY